MLTRSILRAKFVPECSGNQCKRKTVVVRKLRVCFLFPFQRPMLRSSFLRAKCVPDVGAINRCKRRNGHLS